MMYDHEQRERTNNGEIKHLPMPPVRNQFSPAMYSYLNDRELDYELAKHNGWYPTESRGARIVIPCVNSAHFNYWQARAMLDHPIRYDSPAIPRKDSIVLLWPRKHRSGGTVIITEGPMKSLAAAEFYPSIATMGSKPSGEVMAYIAQKTSELGLYNIVVVPDLDALEYIDEFKDFNPRVVLPTCKDLDQMPRWERTKLLEKL